MSHQYSGYHPTADGEGNIPLPFRHVLTYRFYTCIKAITETPNTVTYNNPGAIDDDSVIAGLEAQGYSFRVDTAIEGAIVGAINDAYDAGYEDGYTDGYADGFRDGFDAGVASVR